MLLTKVKGRTRFFSTITAITKTGAGRWDVQRNGRTYQVEGGKAAGGSANDWFVDGFGSKAITANSMVEALRLIDEA